MDDEARRSHKKTMVKAFGNHSSFKVEAINCSGYPTFTVNHFNSPITYSAEGFLERILDSLNPDLDSLLRGFTTGTSNGTEGIGSFNPFVKGLFSAKAIATQAHPKNEDTNVSAQQPVKPMCALSMRCRGTIKQLMPLRKDGAIEEHRHEEDGMLSETQCWLIFCVNPSNDSQLPNQLEGRSMKGQIRSLGLTEISKRNANVFEIGLTPDKFCALTPICWSFLWRVFSVQYTNMLPRYGNLPQSFRLATRLNFLLSPDTMFPTSNPPMMSKSHRGHAYTQIR
ncbi:hypothetical protein JVT61DRAFT_13355 [Boletus reticuloceps]|uniref:Uncharacterized protein n=1 Tax=Boletus reticuloceps TaxID=495285 RepID=A0A8I3A3L5_9AGAM|nr:hypothetical protein JVT61DRAFT_13355 [Boletus reticuloceps]